MVASESIEQLLDAKGLGIRGLLAFHICHKEDKLYNLHKLLAPHQALAPGIELRHELLADCRSSCESMPLRHSRHSRSQLGGWQLACTLGIHSVERVHARVHERLGRKLGSKPIGDAGLTSGLHLMPHPRHHHDEPCQINKFVTANTAVAVRIKHSHNAPAVVFGDIQGSSLGQLHHQRHQLLHLQSSAGILVHLVELLQARARELGVTAQLLHPDWQAVLKLAQDQSVLFHQRQHLRHALGLRHVDKQLGVAASTLLPEHDKDKCCIGFKIITPQSRLVPEVLQGEAQAIAVSTLLAGRTCNRH
mmetsp:Transcript_94003/g.215073  ORF Transcript_94003/g.215073 Transcript_94003/m.215073 type:complete len:305 (-) Transcript_94003:596-1510(-)